METDNREILVILRFGQFEHLKSLLLGNITFKAGEYYQKLEDENRKDENECISGIMQNPELMINGQNIEGARFLRYTTGIDLDYILCFSAITNDIIDKYKIQLDKNLLKLGEYFIVFHNFPEFVNRIKLSLENDLKLAFKSIKGDLVNYKDYSSYSGLIGPFIKNYSFSFQNEYRLVISLEKKIDIVNLEIGDISDIAEIFPTNKISDIIKVTYNK